MMLKHQMENQGLSYLNEDLSGVMFWNANEWFYKSAISF
jgi:hypothetical protein